MLADIVSLSAKLIDFSNKLEFKTLKEFFEGTLEYCSNLLFQDISYIQCLFQMLALPARCSDENEEDIKKESSQHANKGGVSFVIDIN